MKPKIIIVLGPTAVGKSDIALELALRIKGEIINADSQQVYRQINIGTAKPTKEQRDRVPHHLIDIVDLDEEFNVARYRELAMASAEDIRQRDKQTIVCGGTGLYIKALTQGLFVGPAQDAAIREALAAEARRHGLGSLYKRLERVDPAATAWIHPNDGQRIMRALEVYELTGRPMSEWQQAHGFNEAAFETLKIGVYRERAELYDLIDRRCDKMIETGLVEEVKELWAKGYSLDLKPLRSVGYKHVGFFLKGQMSLKEAVVVMKRDTRRLAKRQLTWFRGDKEIRWWHAEGQSQEIFEAAARFLQ